MSWSLGGVTIHVDELRVNATPVIGTLHVLDATEDTLHYSGANSVKLNIAATLFTSDSGSGELFTLVGFKDSGDPVELVTDHGSWGNWYLESISCDRKQALNYQHPVYRVEISLIQDSI